MDLLEGEPGASAAGIGNHKDVAVEDVVEANRAGASGLVGVVDDQMVNLGRIVRVGEIIEAEFHCPIRRVGVDEQRALLVEIKTSLGARRRTAGADDFEDRAAVYCGPVDRRTSRDDPEPGVGVRGIVDHQRLAQGIRAVRQQQRSVGGERVARRGRQIAWITAGVDLGGVRAASGNGRRRRPNRGRDHDRRRCDR